MPRLAEWAQTQPDKSACHFPDTGTIVTFAMLHDGAERAARWLVSLGLQAGDSFALLMENHPAVFELAFAGQRAGLYWVPLNIHLKVAELTYVLRDSGARVLVAGPDKADVAAEIVARLQQQGGPALRIFLLDGSDPRFPCYGTDAPLPPLPERPIGRDLLYSSGTTGLPKGVHRALLPAAERGQPRPVTGAVRAFACRRESVYLSAAPLYHAAPHRFTMHALEQGATCIVTRKFDAAQVLSLIARFRVTHAQFVPTMFIRLLALPQAVRDASDCTSLQRVIHAAAPCPIPVKEAMIAWWGPIIYEYYAGSETIGSTGIESADWLLHKGSVGRADYGTVHITDDEGTELPPRAIGSIRFSGTLPFEYRNAPEKTASAYDRNGWPTYGDVGWLDEDGYLYLSDRRTDLIISGGVNIYPQEVETVLSQHPAVADAAIIGVPDAEFGEQVKGVVQLHGDRSATSDELVRFCREHLAGLKCPRSIDIVAALPRSETGKLLRRVLKEQYRAGAAA